MAFQKYENFQIIIFNLNIENIIHFDKLLLMNRDKLLIKFQITAFGLQISE